jgi:hypothetical protein
MTGVETCAVASAEQKCMRRRAKSVDGDGVPLDVVNIGRGRKDDTNHVRVRDHPPTLSATTTTATSSSVASAG